MLLNADREFLQNHQNSNFIREYFYPVDTGPKLNVHKRVIKKLSQLG